MTIGRDFDHEVETMGFDSGRDGWDSHHRRAMDLCAQEQTVRANAPDGNSRPPADNASSAGAVGRRINLDEALLRPFDMPFAKDTPLDDVAKYLKTKLVAPVVLDLAGAQSQRTSRRNPRSGSSLEGVRLRPG